MEELCSVVGVGHYSSGGTWPLDHIGGWGLARKERKRVHPGARGNLIDG